MEVFHALGGEHQRYPLVVSIPHSGTHIPGDIRSAMLPGAVLPNMDWFLRELYAFLPELGVTTLSSNVSRYVIDLNRDKDEDQGGIDFWTTLVYARNTFEQPIYSLGQHPGPDEIQRRIEAYYNPYHRELERLIEYKLIKFKRVLLLDLHSFSVDFEAGADEDVSLSNYAHQTSSRESMETLRAALADQGYQVGVNVILGRYILRHYKQLFGDCIDCIQMELRYSQYIEDRYFGEEELTGWNRQLFHSAQLRLKAAFSALLQSLGELQW